MDAPRTFGKYTLRKHLATGGMAEIFLARQGGMGGFEKDVALKRLLPAHAENEELVSMFMDEARIAAALTHPNIAQIFDLGQVGDDYFIAMEYVRGVDLRQLCAQGVAERSYLPLQHAIRILVEVCDALEYAHTRKDNDGRPLSIVHRDVSPTNILVTYEGGVKLVDFGIAKAANQIATTRAGQIKGKFGYMAPEQAQGLPIDARTDVFAVGINLYEITLGRRLFKGDSEVETLQAIEACQVPAPRTVDPRYPEALERIVLKALARSPEDRYQSARELQMALEEFQANAGLRATAGMLSEYLRRLFKERLSLEENERPSAPPMELDESAVMLDAAPVREALRLEGKRREAPPALPSRPPTRPPEPWSLNQLTPTPALASSPSGVARRPLTAPPPPPPPVLAMNDDEKLRKPRSYAGLLMLLLIAAGGFALYTAMERDIENPRERGNPNMQPFQQRIQDFGKVSGELPEEAPPARAMVRLTSDPPGARVVVNGNTQSGLTPTAVETFADGWLDVRMLLPGFMPLEKHMKLAGNELDLQLTLTPGQPPVASLFVETEPAGAALSLNGAQVGLTPLTLPKVAAGTELNMALSLAGHYNHVVTYTLETGQNRAISVKMVPDAGPRTMAMIKVDSDPTGARIMKMSADGKTAQVGVTSRTMVNLNAPLGRQLHLRAEKDGYGPVETTVDVREPYYTLYLRLPPPERFFGSFSLLGERGLTVYVGSEEVGKTPVRKHALEEGEHTVVVVHDKSGQRAEFKVMVKRDETLEKSAVLESDKLVIR